MDIPYLMVSECWMLNPMFIVTIYIYIGLLMTMNSSMSSISSMANTQDADDE